MNMKPLNLFLLYYPLTVEEFTLADAVYVGNKINRLTGFLC